MARTPLLRALRRIASWHHEARQRRLPVAAVQDERAAPLDRRRFLTGAGALLAATTLPRLARAKAAPRIAIVGGGLSGLSAALRLHDAGVAATVYEAGGRIGGRVFSNRHYFADGQVTEWCGELIDTNHTTVQQLARRFGLTLDNLRAAEPAAATETYYFYGQSYSFAQALADFRPVAAVLAADHHAAGYPSTYAASTAAGRALDQMSVRDWIHSRIPGGTKAPLGALLEVAYTVEYGADAGDQSALNLVYLLGAQPKPNRLALFGESDEAYHVRGGNQQLPVAMADSLGIGRVVKLGWRLLALARRSSGDYELTFTSHGRTQTVHADLVVLTLPFAVLRTLDYAAAGFDARKREAITQLGRGRNGKLQLQFTGRTWAAAAGPSTGGSFADTGYQNTWDASRAQPGGHGILVAFTGGSTTAALASTLPFVPIESHPGVGRDAQRFLRGVEPVLHGLRPRWNGRATSSIPHLDRNFALAYSYWRVGQYTRVAGYEAVPQGGVFFAGEHTSVDFQGYMEGAAQEGLRAADEVLGALGIASRRRATAG